MLAYKNVDVVVIGGGAAGLGAAIRSKEAGAEDVFIIERAEQLGGVLPQCIHNGFGLIYFNENLTGPEYIHWFIDKAEKLGIEKRTRSMVLGITPDRKVWGVSQEDGIFQIQAKTIILAMGCRERTRGNICIPGMRPAGIFTAGTAQRLVNIEGYLPGRKVVVIGSGDIGMIMARRFLLEGCQVEGVVEILPYCSGLIRNEVQCLIDFNIPLYLAHATVGIKGKERVESVTIAKLTEDMKGTVPGSEKEIECDTVLFAVGLIPENELSINAGVVLDDMTRGPIVNEGMETNIPGVFAAGNVVQVYDFVDYATMMGEVAGENAVKFIQSGHRENKIKVKKGNNVQSIAPQVLTGETKSDLKFRVTKPMDRGAIMLNGQKKKTVEGIRPSEMLTVKLDSKDIKKLTEDTGELEINVEQLSSRGRKK
jgi:NADPH-dependent 2,4-dienoyl-CoA reductase/sulfur reductase-like enzyme